MAWTHATKYRFYAQKYPSSDEEETDLIDIEEEFKCRYVKMTGNTQTDVKNVYTEDFAEMNGKKTWCPDVEDIAYNSSEISLYLRWRSDECGDVLEWSDKFFEYATGQKIEYHDTFRPNRYWQLVMTKAPEVQTELLNQEPKYLIIKYTFTNFGGKYYKQSQI